jgi:hypothetical protein
MEEAVLLAKVDEVLLPALQLIVKGGHCVTSSTNGQAESA